MIQKIYEILKEFKEPTDLMEFDIYEKISQCIQNEMKDQKLDLNSKPFYEWTAFRLSMTNNEQEDLEEWKGLMYVPFFYTRDKDGKLISNPDIKNITVEMVDYWEKRAFEVDQYPILQCRYAGLVWSFSLKIRDKKPDISLAHKFIDSAKNIAFLDKNTSEKKYIGHVQTKLEKALKIAVDINDKQRTLSIKDTIIDYENTHAKDNLPGTWGHSFDLLIGDRKLYKKDLLTKEEEDKIIKELERKLNIFSDQNPKIFRPDVIENIVKKLAFYYNSKQDKENMQRVLIKYKDSMLSIENLPALIKEPLLKKVREILLQYGLSTEAKKLETEIRSLQEKSQKELEFKKNSVSIPIPKEVIDSYITELNNRTLSDAIDFIAMNFIPDKEKSKNLAIEIAYKHPLQNFVSQTIVNDKGREIAEIGPIEKDIEGRTVQQMIHAIGLKIHFLTICLNYLIKTKSLSSDSLSQHLLQSGLFPETHRAIIKEGVNAFLEKKYITCCSILIPQIEVGIRELISRFGGETYNIKLSKEKGFQLRPLGALLRDKKFIQIFEKIDKNIPFYFQVLLTDSRGYNLRNNICHGDLPSHHFNETSALLIIHTLLILSIFFRSSTN